MKHVLNLGVVSIIAILCGPAFSHVQIGGCSIARFAIANNPVDPADSSWLYWEALEWDKIAPEKGMDTMRLFVETYPHLIPYNTNGLGWTVNFASELAQHDTYIDKSVWIEEYNWLASVYELDTARRFREDVLAQMAASATYFNLNLSANIWHNISLLFPFAAGTAMDQITEIRKYQAMIPQDTTPFYTMDIPPKPYLAVGSRAAEASELLLRVYPNPATSELHVEAQVPASTSTSIELYDALGNVVIPIFAGRLATGELQIDKKLDALPPGTYYLRMGTPQSIMTRSVVIKH